MGQQLLSLETSNSNPGIGEQITVDIFHEVQREDTESGAIKLSASLFFNGSELQLDSIEYPSESFNSSFEATLEDNNNDDAIEETNQRTAINFQQASLQSPYPDARTNIATATFTVLEEFEGSEVSVLIPSETAQTYNNAPDEVFEPRTLSLELEEPEPEPEPEPDPGDNPDDSDDPINLEQTIELFRFRNTTFDTGTYVFVGAAERDAILANEDFSQTFELEGNGNSAFTASTEDGDNLIPFYRLQSIDTPGTYLFVSTQEYDAIFAPDSDQRDKWVQEGTDNNGNDIPEFYLLDGSADRGTEFNRFQNTQNGTFLYAGPAETAAIENDPNLSDLFTNQGTAFESL
jgi:hypothetical protein